MEVTLKNLVWHVFLAQFVQNKGVEKIESLHAPELTWIPKAAIFERRCIFCSNHHFWYLGLLLQGLNVIQIIAHVAITLLHIGPRVIGAHPTISHMLRVGSPYNPLTTCAAKIDLRWARPTISHVPMRTGTFRNKNTRNAKIGKARNWVEILFEICFSKDMSKWWFPDALDSQVFDAITIIWL